MASSLTDITSVICTSKKPGSIDSFENKLNKAQVTNANLGGEVVRVRSTAIKAREGNCLGRIR